MGNLTVLSQIMNSVHYHCRITSTLTRRERERTERTQLILEGARRVFEREGHGGLSIRKVAKEIDFSPGTLYLYYRDKDALMLALHEEAFARKAGMFAPLMSVEDPMERLVAMGRSYIRHALEHPSDFHLMFVDDCPMQTLLDENREWHTTNGAFSMVRATVAEGIGKQRFRENVQAESMAVILWSMVHGCAMLILSKRLGMLSEESRERAVDDMFAQMRTLLVRQS